MDKIAICAIFKDEAPFLLEWLAFHRMIGVDLFVLYDNGSSDGGADRVHASSFGRNVTLVDWPDRPGQLSAYNHFRIHHAARFTWAAFIDIDEFIVPLEGNSIRPVLMRPAYARFAQVLLQWLVFGPSGHERRPEGLMIEHYTHRMPETADACRHVKAIVRPTCCAASTTRRMRRSAVGPPATAAAPRSCRSQFSRPSAMRSCPCITTSPSRARTGRSSAARGRGDSLEPYQERVFSDVAGEAVIEDTRALRFVPRLRALLQS